MTATTDRELLELAAKAAGYKFSDFDFEGEHGLQLLMPHAKKNWNPLEDLADRYDLLRKLNANLYFSGQKGYVEIPSGSDEPAIIERFDKGDDRDEGHAIVRAAAEIGKGMK